MFAILTKILDADEEGFHINSMAIFNGVGGEKKSNLQLTIRRILILPYLSTFYLPSLVLVVALLEVCSALRIVPLQCYGLSYLSVLQRRGLRY